MARQFGIYSPAVPLGVTWEEELILTDEADTPIDLTGFSVRAQLRELVPDVDPETGEATTAPVLELTTSGYYATAPDWPVFDVMTVTALEGKIVWKLPVDDLWTASPDNAKRVLVWSLILEHTDETVIPAVQGKCIFLRATTV